MKKRRRIGLRKSFSDAISADRGGGGEEGATIFTAIWYWIVGVPVTDDDEKLPSDEPDFIVIVPWLPFAQADAAFDDWLRGNALTRVQIAPDVRISTGRGKSGDLRRYLIRRGSPGDRTA